MRYPEEPLRIKASEQSVAKLLEAIRIGTPLHIALTYSRISKAEYEYCKGIVDQIHKAEELQILNHNILESTIRERCEGNGVDFELVMNVRAKKDYAAACVEFIESIEQAKAECIVRNLQRLEVKEKFSNWQASAWLLERRCPDEFGKKEDASETPKAEPMSIEIVNPKSDSDRLQRMEKEVEDETNS